MRTFFLRSCLLATAGLSVLGLTACDDDGPLAIAEEPILYEGSLQPLNDSGVTGSATFAINDFTDRFSVAVSATGLDASIPHAQHIHSEAACPGPAQDANGDGWVDVVEGLPQYGGILTSLDDDLSVQAPNTFPTASASGAISYERTTSLEAVVTSVRGEDEDIFVELSESEPLSPEVRTVVVHGVDPSTDLPETVQSLAGLPAHATIPVACAQIDLAGS